MMFARASAPGYLLVVGKIQNTGPYIHGWNLSPRFIFPSFVETKGWNVSVSKKTLGGYRGYSLGNCNQNLKLRAGN